MHVHSPLGHRHRRQPAPISISVLDGVSNGKAEDRFSTPRKGAMGGASSIRPTDDIFLNPCMARKGSLSIIFFRSSNLTGKFSFFYSPVSLILEKSTRNSLVIFHRRLPLFRKSITKSNATRNQAHGWHGVTRGGTGWHGVARGDTV